MGTPTLENPGKPQISGYSQIILIPGAVKRAKIAEYFGCNHCSYSSQYIS
jgi:hypothetical protein